MTKVSRRSRRWFRRFQHTRAWLVVRLAVVAVAATVAVWLVSLALTRG